jgi:hypothetical protein
LVINTLQIMLLLDHFQPAVHKLLTTAIGLQPDWTLTNINCCPYRKWSHNFNLHFLLDLPIVHFRNTSKLKLFRLIQSTLHHIAQSRQCTIFDLTNLTTWSLTHCNMCITDCAHKIGLINVSDVHKTQKKSFYTIKLQSKNFLHSDVCNVCVYIYIYIYIYIRGCPESKDTSRVGRWGNFLCLL